MPRHNNFDGLRLFAALLVLFSHSFSAAGRPEPLIERIGGQETFGTIGVAIFFVISGYLVSASFSRRSVPDYLKSRALRIIPALVLISCFDVFVIGPAFTTLPLSAYFMNPATWSHLANLRVFGISEYLPGVFSSLPIQAVNGSLWTLPPECSLYLALPVVAFFGGATKRGSVIVFGVCAISSFILLWLWVGEGIHGFRVPALAAKLATYFFAGSALWANRDSVSLRGAGAFGCVAMLCVLGPTPAQSVAFATCLPYLVIFAAVKTPVLSLEKIGDLSYGTYLFAFPIQQSLVAMYGFGPWLLMTTAVPLVLMLALASWRLVEAPSLRFRKRWPADATAVTTAQEPATVH